jgi:ribosome-associated translation inhibitor RaiA
MVNKRKPVVDQIPRAMKSASSRNAKTAIPSNIRLDSVELDDEDREYVRRRLGDKLGRYASSVERVSVRMRDVNGPRGGVDVQCRIKVVLGGMPSVVAEHQAAEYRPALTAALASAERAVRKALQRRRQKPIRSGKR